MRSWVVVALAVLLVASSAAATELHYGGEVKGIYTSNIFGTSSGEEYDGSFRGSPFFEFRQPDGEFRWSFKYDPSYERYIEHSDLSGWDHDVAGGFTWSIDPRVVLRVSDRFDRFRSLSRFNQTVGVAGGGTAVEAVDQQQPFIQNTASVSLELHPSKTRVFTLFGDHYLWDFSNNSGRRDQQSMDAGIRFLQTVNERLQLGSTLSWSHQYFASINLVPSSETDYYHVAGNVVYVFDPTFQINLSAGPTLVVPPSAPSPPTSADVPQFPVQELNNNGIRFRDINTCPTLGDGTPFLTGVCRPFGATFTGLLAEAVKNARTTVFFTGPEVSAGGNQITYFANASISKVWENWNFLLSYQRQANQSSGVGTNSIADIVLGSVHWHPTQKWNLYVNGTWIQRSQQGSSVATVLGLKPNTSPSVPYPNAAESASLRSVKLSNSAEIATWNVGVYAGYRLTKRITLFGFGSWNRNISSGSYVRTTTADIYTFWTGIRYEFEPIHF